LYLNTMFNYFFGFFQALGISKRGIVCDRVGWRDGYGIWYGPIHVWRRRVPWSECGGRQVIVGLNVVDDKL
jgi:hypothetical protein